MIILIAEDERKTRELIATFLEGTTATDIYTARTGLEAVKLAGDLRPDIILLDGLLPELHGFEATRLIRNLDPSYRPLIILMTAIYKKRTYENEARLKWGVDRYLHKPFTREQLLDAMKRMPAVTSADEERPGR